MEGYLEEEGTLKNMEPGAVVAREIALHSHSLVCRDAKRDLLYSRSHTRSCQWENRGEVALDRKELLEKSRSRGKQPNSTRRHGFLYTRFRLYNRKYAC